MRGARLGAAAVLSFAGLAVGGVLLALQSGPYQAPEAAPLLLVDATATALDTVHLGGRTVTATLNGTVVEMDTDGAVWLDTGEDAVRLALPEAADLQVEDRLLVVGRLRGRGGRRWVDAEAWSRVASRVTTEAVRPGE